MGGPQTSRNAGFPDSKFCKTRKLVPSLYRKLGTQDDFMANWRLVYHLLGRKRCNSPSKILHVHWDRLPCLISTFIPYLRQIITLASICNFADNISCQALNREKSRSPAPQTWNIWYQYHTPELVLFTSKSLFIAGTQDIQALQLCSNIS